MHCRIVTGSGRSKGLDELYPIPEAKHLAELRSASR